MTDSKTALPDAQELVEALYAAGLHLHRAHELVELPPARRHIHDAVASIDETIKYIHNEFYSHLRAAPPTGDSLHIDGTNRQGT
ncbi:hypothetical protein ABZ639_02835 [Saccharomonospora sp. NPDC006951]